MIRRVVITVQGNRLSCDAEGCVASLIDSGEDAGPLAEEAREAGWALGSGEPGSRDLCPRHAREESRG